MPLHLGVDLAFEFWRKIALCPLVVSMAFA